MPTAKLLLEGHGPEQSWDWLQFQRNCSHITALLQGSFPGTLHVRSTPRYRVIHLVDDEEFPYRKCQGRRGFGLSSFLCRDLAIWMR